MANEIETKEVEETEVEEASETEVTDTDSEETEEKSEAKADEKPKESSEAKLARLERQAKQLRKKLGVADPETKTSKKSDEFDEGQLAYLVAKGIDQDEDVDWTQKQLKERGGTLRELLSKKWFTEELKERKDNRSALEAAPTSKGRSSARPTDLFERANAEYQKTGKLPEDLEMADKVIEARRKAAKGPARQFKPPVGNF